MKKYKVKSEGKDVIIDGINDFSIGQTLECGQCFHFYKLKEEDYLVVAFDKLLHIEQCDKKVIMHDTTLEEFENIWERYFDLDRDYNVIKKYLLKEDETLREAIEEKWGVRILNQEFSETLMSFIISQTKQIPQIKQVVNDISKRFGKMVGEYNGEKYYAFPSVEELKMISNNQFLECKAGFRAPYLVNAAMYLDEKMNKDYFSSYTYEEAKKELTSIKGVGEKVANCVLLFALGYRNAFPVDVWIKRTMEELYFKEETKKDVIQKFAEEKFGEYGGYAQQYLFFYGKTTLNKNK